MPAMASQPRYDHEVADVLRGPSSADAREALVYWRGRLETLPRRRRAARREARAMVCAWEERLRRAEHDRWGGGLLGHAAGAVAVLRTERPRALARRALRLVPRPVVVAVLTVTLGTALVVGAVLGALLGALL
jgi:hypothetical protein